MRQPDVLQAALDVVAPFARGRQGRVVVGICGPPAAGKSTLSSALAQALPDVHIGLSSVAVPMDGFHLSNVELERLGLTDRKGAPETFDSAGFVHLLRRLRAGEDLVYAPAYSRTLHESIGGAIPVPSSVRVVVVEGNYLLLEHGPWASVRDLLDLVLYLDAPDNVRQESLVRRQLAKGLDLPEAQDWVLRSDEANASVIAATRNRADLILTR
ncbi:nucleoside/nucleotide kinase family protein [Dactylosporangium sp. NPDC051485]|uniref:nucleoside/nucleotide kinase family protein n=1 Tax=Dactylosporangium sp. NPDC051485 TaxID=3154846 RepID=UPI00343381F8